MCVCWHQVRLISALILDKDYFFFFFSFCASGILATAFCSSCPSGRFIHFDFFFTEFSSVSKLSLLLRWCSLQILQNSTSLWSTPTHLSTCPSSWSRLRRISASLFSLSFLSESEVHLEIIVKHHGSVELFIQQVVNPELHRYRWCHCCCSACWSVESTKHRIATITRRHLGIFLNSIHDSIIYKINHLFINYWIISHTFYFIIICKMYT